MKKTIYECDCCGKASQNPHALNLREFDYVEGLIHKRKIHLCVDCFRNLHAIHELSRRRKKNWEES